MNYSESGVLKSSFMLIRIFFHVQLIQRFYITLLLQIYEKTTLMQSYGCNENNVDLPKYFYFQKAN